mgnify:CR=1 FL=1
MRLFDLRLRFWAHRQFMYELEHHSRVSEDAFDFTGARWRLLMRSVIRGHLDDRCFVSMEPDFPQLGDPDILRNDDAVVRVACSHLERYLDMGARRSGVLEGYLRAQRDHLQSCRRCRRFVCAVVRGDVATGRQISAIFDGLSPAAKREIAEEFIPPRPLRRRGASLK